MRDPVALLQQLQAAPDRFDFYAALRLLENAHPDRPRIGQSQRPQDDPLRFGQEPTLAFAPAMLAALQTSPDGGSARLLVNFFGLLGANGPLPIHLTEYVRDRQRNAGDQTLARFLDMFHHRLISLFYRSWASAQPTVSLDRPDSDRFAAYVASLLGLGMDSLRARDSVPDLAKLHFAGRLAGHARNADGLRAILSDFFKLPVAIEQFVGHWMALPPDGLCSLRSGPDAERLGVSTVIGTKVWNRQHKFRIVIGPLSLAQYRQMLPGGDSLPRLVDWVRNYIGDTYEWDVQLILEKQEVPRLKLAKQAARLGWTSWLASRPPERDAGQLRLNLSRKNN